MPLSTPTMTPSLRGGALEPVTPYCQIEKLVAIRLARPDLQQTMRFFEDFGLTTVYVDESVLMLRGRFDETPCVIVERGLARYLGLSVQVASHVALEALAQVHQVAVVDNHPIRGGQAVLLKDPDHLLVEVVCGLHPLPRLDLPPVIPHNCEGKQHRINQTVRLDQTFPTAVLKLGHTVLGVSNMNASLAWYQQNLGLIVSDFQMIEGDPVPVVAFMRCNRGMTPTDHHSIAIGSAVELGHLHTAFELADLNAVVAANLFLHQQRHHHTWGIGRHILGSQLFDYWRDAHGDMFEHYADGDLFDATVPTGYHAFGDQAMHQWGAALNADMAGKTPSRHLIQTVISRLRSDDDLSLGRLFRLVKAAG